MVDLRSLKSDYLMLLEMIGFCQQKKCISQTFENLRGGVGGIPVLSETNKCNSNS